MDSLADWATSRLAVEVFTVVVLKATIILGIAWLATTLLRRASAALRHGVWSLALGSLLLLPLLSVFMPSWSLDLPEGIEPLLIYHRADEAPRETAPALVSAAERPLGVDASQQPVAVEHSGEVRLDAPGPLPPDAGPAVVPGSAMPLGMPWPVWLLLVWSAGVLALSGHLLLQALRLRMLARHAERLADARRTAEVAHLARRLGIRRHIPVLCSPEVSMAMTWGLRRPVVMLPYTARRWSDARRQVVLLHELAHIKRGDYLIHLAVHIVQAFYWFNPLVWIATRRVHVEQERACDDQVLQAGTGACDYAAHLLDIARAFLKRPATLPDGIAMVRGSTLKERVRAILNAGSNRHALSFKTGLAAACTGTCLILPVAALQLCPSALEGDAAPPVASAVDPGIALPPMAGLRTDAPAPAPAHDAASVEDRQALDRIEAMLHDDCPDVRAAAVRAMARLCRCHALERLPVALADPHPRVRMTAARVLGKTIHGLRTDDSPRSHRILRDHLRPAVGALIGALRDADPIVRKRVAYALGEARDGAAVEALKTAIRDEAAPVRLEAVRAIGKIGATCAAAALHAALDDPDPEVRALAADVLNQFDAS